MQDAAFAAAGLRDWSYELWDTPLEQLPARMDAIRNQDDVAGANVTVPHKLNVMPYLDAVSPQARAIGAVNTIIKVRHHGASVVHLLGDNTDWIGFLNDLRWHAVEPAELRRALVLGAGGSARGIVYALASQGLAVDIVNRDAARAERLALDMHELFPSIPLCPFGQSVESLREAGRGVQIIVNCTSAGMSPNADTSPWVDGAPFPAGAVLYDLVYKPPVTKLMQQAQAAGLRVVGGIGMLAEQGAAAFEKWTGVSAQNVTAVMRRTLGEA
jgi:shikimate dehydrogenase